MVINRQDTNGVKPLLQTGEFGFDNFASGGDNGRVYVGNGTVNIALAKKSEVDAKVVANVDITAGTATKVTYDAKGLVTSGTTLSAGDIPVLDASKITTGTLPVARGGTGATTSTGTGDVVLSTSPVLVTPVLGVATGTSFNSITGLSNTAALAAGIAAIGTNTLVARQDHVHPVQTTISGNAGTATTLATARTIGMTGDVTWTSTSFNGGGNVTGTATLATITDSGTGSFKKITANSKGLVTGTVSVTQADITGLLGAGSISNTMLANGAVATLSGTNTGDETLATIKTKLGITTLSGSNTGDQTITLTGDVTGTGTGSFVTTLKNTGTTGTYRSVTTDAQGRVTAGTNPTTISGYGITDAYTKAELNAGQLDNRYYTEAEIDTLYDTAVKLTGNQTIGGIKTFTSSPIVPTPIANTQAVNKVYVDGKYSGFKNYIINGNFSVWQRGTDFNATGYCADRWHLAIGGSVNAMKHNIAPNTILVSTSAASSFANLYQAIETATVIGLRGKTLTLSLKLQTEGTHTGGFALSARYSNSTDTLNSQTTGIQSLGISASSTNTRYSLTFTVPADAVGLRIDIENTSAQPSGALCQVQEVQLEEGSIATPFENRPYGLELSLCQRYYEEVGSFFTGLWDTSTITAISIPYKVKKRGIPTIAKINGRFYVHRYNYSDTSLSTFAISNAFGNVDSLFTQVTGLSGGTVNGAVISRNNYSDDTNNFLSVSSEL